MKLLMQFYVLNKQNNTQKNTNSDTGINLDSKALLIKDLGNTYNLLFGDVCYTIKLSHNKEIKQTSYWPECFIDFDLFGYFTEKITLNSSLDNMPNELNETIIYGIRNNDIIFYYFNESSKKTVEYELKGSDIFNISCRMFEEDKYICSFTTELYFRTCIFSCLKNLTCIQLRCGNDNTKIYSDGFIYDTLNSNVKLLIAKNNVNCSFDWANIIIDSINGIYTLSQISVLSRDYNAGNCETKNCDFIQFYSEYLFCCACQGYIICTRFDLNFQLINQFKSIIIGKNSNLQIFNNEKYVSIYFINSLSDNKGLNRINIYPPSCKNLTKEIKKDEDVDISVNQLLDRKSDIKYYLTFIEFETDKLTIKFKENNVIFRIGETHRIKNDNDLDLIFSLILDNNIMDNHLYVIYNISMEETYNDICSIDLIVNQNDVDLTTIISTIEHVIESSMEKTVEIMYSINIICHETCESCSSIPEKNNEGEIINQNCINCTDGYHLLSNTTNCYDDSILSRGYYLSSINYEYYKCNHQCRTCKEISTNENPNCLSCSNNTFLFRLNNSCINSCPYNYEANNELNKCELKNLEKASIEEFKNEIMNNISSFINSSNVINNTDFIAVIYDIENSNPKEQLKNGISAIDLGNCTNKIKEFYNIDDFIVLNMESKYNKSENANDNSLNIGKNNQIEIYNYSGKKLNLSICNEDIKIMKYIGDIEKLDIESAMNLADKGIDVFNASDKFFNDLCHYYDNKDGKDIIITDRRNDIYQNVTFCQNGCEYMGMDYDLMAANCSCDTNILQNTELNNVKEGENSNKEKFNFDDLKKSFISNLYDFNYRVMYFHNLVINLNILKKNIGFYSMISLLIFQIIFLIIYIIKGLNSIKQDIFNFKFKKGKNNLMFPPPKNNNKIENNTKYNFNNNNDQNEKDNNYSIERKNDNSKSNIKLAIKNMDEPYLDKNTIKSDRKQIKDKISKNNKRQLKPKKSLFKKKIKKKKKQKMETTEEKNQKNKFNNNNIKIKELYIK